MPDGVSGSGRFVGFTGCLVGILFGDADGWLNVKLVRGFVSWMDGSCIPDRLSRGVVGRASANGEVDVVVVVVIG